MSPGKAFKSQATLTFVSIVFIQFNRTNFIHRCEQKCHQTHVFRWIFHRYNPLWPVFSSTSWKLSVYVCRIIITNWMRTKTKGITITPKKTYGQQQLRMHRRTIKNNIELLICVFTFVWIWIIFLSATHMYTHSHYMMIYTSHVYLKLMPCHLHTQTHHSSRAKERERARARDTSRTPYLVGKFKFLTNSNKKIHSG